MSRILTGALSGALLLLIIWAFIQIAEDHDRWVAWCAGVGGHVIADTDLHTGVGYAPGNGQSGGGVVVTTSSSTDYYCLSETGGILDIR